MKKSTILGFILGLVALCSIWYAYAFGPENWPQGILFACFVWGTIIFFAMAHLIYELRQNENSTNDATWEDYEDDS